MSGYNISSLKKGLVLDMKLDSDSEKTSLQYASDFTAGADSWLKETGVLSITGNIDVGGETDTLRFTLNSGNSVHYIDRATPTTTVGKSYRIMFDYYIPSSNSNADGIRLFDGAGSAYQGTQSVLDAWTSNSVDIVATVTDHVRFYAYDGGAITFEDAGGNDVLYIKNYKILELQTADNTPNSNNGVVYGATQNAEDMSFNGTSDYIQLTDTQTLAINTSLAFTAKINVKDYSGIIGHTAGGTNYLRFGQSTGTENNRIYGETHTEGDTLILDFDGSLSYDTWYDFVIVRDGSIFKLYVNGSLQSDTDSSSVDLYFSRIGQGRGGSDYLDGSMKKMKFYNRALSADEIELLYKGLGEVRL